MTDLPDVRIANRGDEEEIIALCRMLHEENGLFSMDEEKVRRDIGEALDGENGIVGVIGEPQELHAFTYLRLGQFWYTSDWSLEERFVFVHPDHRQSKNLQALIAFDKQMSDKLRVPLVIGILSTKRTEAKVRAYQRYLPSVGAFFFYRGAEADGR